MSAPVLYVLKRFPRLSETFVVREIAALETLGERILIDALLPPEDGPAHPEVALLEADVRYLPPRPSLLEPSVCRAHARLFLRRPRTWLREARHARRDGTWRRFLQAGLTAERARERRARHLHAHFATAAAEVAGIAGRLASLPVSVTAHAKDIYQEEHAPLLARRLAGAATVVTVSAHNRAHLERVLPRAAVAHIPNGVAVPEAAHGPHPAGVVLCVARLVAKKGIDTLLSALAALDRPDVRAEIVGGGPLEQALRDQAATLGLDGRVRFLGPVAFPAVEEAYRGAAMVVLPCRVSPDGDRDGLPTALTEAMARGLPVISTDVAGIPEIVRHGETGLLVPPDDPHALAEAIASLLSDAALGRSLGAAGRALMASDHDPARSALALQRVHGGVAP